MKIKFKKKKRKQEDETNDEFSISGEAIKTVEKIGMGNWDKPKDVDDKYFRSFPADLTTITSQQLGKLHSLYT